MHYWWAWMEPRQRCCGGQGSLLDGAGHWPRQGCWRWERAYGGRIGREEEEGWEKRDGRVKEEEGGWHPWGVP